MSKDQAKAGEATATDEAIQKILDENIPGVGAAMKVLEQTEAAYYPAIANTLPRQTPLIARSTTG